VISCAWESVPSIVIKAPNAVANVNSDHDRRDMYTHDDSAFSNPLALR